MPARRSPSPKPPRSSRGVPLSEMEVLRRYVEDHGLKMTAQRKKIMDVFMEAKGHFSAEELYDRTKKIDPRVGYTTVYRTLRLLCDSGLAQERRFKDGPTRYELDYDRDHHDHLVCVKCGRIVEFENEPIEDLQRKVAAKHGFELVEHRHELYGRCGACRA